jgi:hypothetical protein
LAQFVWLFLDTRRSQRLKAGLSFDPDDSQASYGENNHIVIARRQNEQRLMEQKS